MRAHPLILLTGLTALSTVASAGEERNNWPVEVEQPSALPPARQETTRSGLGPFLFSQPVSTNQFSGAVRARGFRPLFLEAVDSQGEAVETDFLYPLFTYRRAPDGYRWSLFSLVNHYSTQSAPQAAPNQGFDLWPFYFSRDTGNPETSYHAVLPIAGTVRNRFGQDKLSWIGFPLYARWEKNNVTTTTAPWPFIKVLQGEGNEGFELWPLFGQREKANTYREQFYLWPLIFKKETHLWESQPDVKQGFLPFYASSRDGESRSETYLWPFFGYSDRTAPYRYHQTNYFWPLLVQGRGDQRYVNRWGPFYTHSVIKGVDKTWVAWPFWRQQSWTDGALTHNKRQFFFFLYNDTEQRSASNPALPVARKTHYWPVASVWDNGAGRRQVQALSPLEIFFPNNDNVRLLYSPFFAVYRYNRVGPEEVQQSFLWNLVSYRRQPDSSEFHLGPLFSKERNPEEKRYAVGNGVIALEKNAGAGRWHFSFFDFKRRTANRPAGATTP
ncbi:hypothetical protein DB347_13065 [Opitutaceae bacterium EW11]|nr:hypothetical protein DB347_13065 [Opitutaceae bacterium EW11]